MVRNEMLFSVEWRSNAPEDHGLHHFLLFAASHELALTVATQILGDKGRISTVEEFRHKQDKGKAAAAH